jgi:hypothetical protein
MFLHKMYQLFVYRALSRFATAHIFLHEMYQLFVNRDLSRFCAECKILHKNYQKFLTELLVGFDSFCVEILQKFKLVLNSHVQTFYKCKVVSQLILQNEHLLETCLSIKIIYLFKYYYRH